MEEGGVEKIKIERERLRHDVRETTERNFILCSGRDVVPAPGIPDGIHHITKRLTQKYTYIYIPSAGVKSKSLIFTDPVIGSTKQNWKKWGEIFQHTS